MAPGKTSPRTVLARERERLALDMRLKGMSYREIGPELGLSLRGAHDAVVRSLARIEKQAAESAVQIVRIEIERLDEMFKALDERARHGDEKAIETRLHIIEQRAKLLGLYAPTKIAPTDPSGANPYSGLSDTELEREIAAAIASLGIRAQVPLDPARPGHSETTGG